MKHFFSIISILLCPIINAQKVNVNQWNDDIDFYQKTLEKKHIDLYHHISKQELDSKINRLKKNIPALSYFQIVSQLMEITRSIGDGHTSIPTLGNNIHYYPIQLFIFGKDLRVIKASKQLKPLLGMKLKSIDGTSMAKIIKGISPFVQFVENDQSKLYFTTRYLRMAELLLALGFIERLDSAKFEFIGDDGNSEIHRLYANVAYQNTADFNSIQLTIPNLSKPSKKKFEGLWYKSIDSLSAVYIRFRKYPSFQQMDEFGKEVFDYIEKNKTEHLIIDIRDNTGGNFFKGIRLIEYLVNADSIDWKHGVYTVCNRSTYSAAMSNTVQFRQILNSKIVGEPTGANPHGYQDGDDFILPNSGLKIKYSKRLYRFQEINTEGVQPDIYITPKWKKYSKGIDEMLEWIVNDISKKHYR
ncbi:S41 family peptidase [Aquimarina algiphila]|uniref:S41 family peptidase n=1 Tax=Aquimarina algiphila TaxID=2047982 RepID=UPI002491349C|nr:S41 family peptidase [Aquimarina algiphila]